MSIGLLRPHRLPALTLLAFLGVIFPGLAQTGPATTYRPGYWQPASRLDPTKPVTITIKNLADAPLEYEVMKTIPNPSPLPVKGTGSLVVRTFPVFLNIMTPIPEDATAYREVALTFQVLSSKDNHLLIVVKPNKDYFDGARVVNIDAQGSVYTY